MLVKEVNTDRGGSQQKKDGYHNPGPVRRRESHEKKRV
jgi:hypothetical protein